MSYGLTRGTQIITCNSKITKSSIDMNGNTITSIGNITNGTDAVNKNYVDSLIGITTVTLSSTSYTTILNFLEGDFIIQVKNIISGGPSAKFMVTKSDPSKGMHCIRLNSSAGLITLEKLELRWLVSGYIELRKTDVNYDGQYRVKYISN